jgi:hypothetical protein
MRVARVAGVGYCRTHIVSHPILSASTNSLYVHAPDIIAVGVVSVATNARNYLRPDWTVR